MVALSLRSGVCSVAAACLVLAAGASVQAQLSLTPAGVASGYTLTTFASGFATSSGLGPVAIDYQANGTVLVSTYVGNQILRFNNADNQTAAGAPALNYPNSEFPHGLAHVGSTVYVSRYNSQSIVELNPDGSINRTVASALGNARDLEYNPFSGRLFTSTTTGVRDVNIATGAFTTLMTDEADGITLSPDGLVLYGAILSGPRTGHVVGYNTTTGAPVFDSGFISGSPDGTAIGYGLRAGLLYANCNNGTVVEINLTTLAQVVIASGGSRGDFATGDPSGSGDMLLSQSDRVIRLGGIPTPGAAGLLGLGGLLAGTRRRR